MRLAAGAARRRGCFRIPRVDLDQGRPRVPSFYALEVMRAAEGRLPGFAELARARRASRRRAWDGPRREDEDVAIDDAEFDLAVLNKLVRQGSRRDHDRRRALSARRQSASAARVARARAAMAREWTRADGLVDPGPEARAALDASSDPRRPSRYSPTALQNFASCPYDFCCRRFIDSSRARRPRRSKRSIRSLAAPDPRDPVRVADPAARRRPAAGQRARPSKLRQAMDSRQLAKRSPSDGMTDLAPAIERVWKDGIDAIRADLREWLRRAAEDPQSSWLPSASNSPSG